jgi:hypothetical protein
LLHVLPVMQVLPHAPQFAVSVMMLTHVLLHETWPAAHGVH